MWESKHVTWEKLLQPIAIVNIQVGKGREKQAGQTDLNETYFAVY